VVVVVRNDENVRDIAMQVVGGGVNGGQ